MRLALLNVNRGHWYKKRTQHPIEIVFIPLLSFRSEHATWVFVELEFLVNSFFEVDAAISFSAQVHYQPKQDRGQALPSTEESVRGRLLRRAGQTKINLSIP